jgi:hypothetical protein
MLIIEFFSGDFQGQEGVRIMHQCALCYPNYGNIKKMLVPNIYYSFLIHKLLRLGIFVVLMF